MWPNTSKQTHDFSPFYLWGDSKITHSCMLNKFSIYFNSKENKRNVAGYIYQCRGTVYYIDYNTDCTCSAAVNTFINWPRMMNTRYFVFCTVVVASYWVMRAAAGQLGEATIKTGLGAFLVLFFSPGGSLGASCHMNENLNSERTQQRNNRKSPLCPGMHVSPAGNTEKERKKTVEKHLMICVIVCRFDPVY